MSAPVGISGFAVYAPPYRVDLEQWCAWTGTPWDKVRSVIGSGFRMMGPGQSIYTLAATAAIRLVRQYDIDPDRIGFIGLGTESSTDNSAGAVIVRGMLDDVFRRAGRRPISRACEVPEFKHACLGGVYAMKSALRYLALENDPERVAIVVSADEACYERGSSGEPTQGAGAVAMLLESSPKLLEVDIRNTGSASSYRAVDFRKPFARPGSNGAGRTMSLAQVPVFNGKYSTTCYLDETLHALREMCSRLDTDPATYYRSLEAIFMHRPYQRMPENSMAFSYLAGLASNGAAGKAELAEYCGSASLDLGQVVDEIVAAPDILAMAMAGQLDTDPYPLSRRLLREFRQDARFDELVAAKMKLGADVMAELGNVYCASLPCWIAAGLEQAVEMDLDLAGASVLAVGYGSGDAAEAIPMTVAPAWADAAGSIGFGAAMSDCIDLTHDQYLALHAGEPLEVAGWSPHDEFVVEHVGRNIGPRFADDGVEYYAYIA
jgi:hydroxymethylglutaryl-CoA synthase